MNSTQRRFTLFCGLLAACAIASYASTADAAIVTYTNRATWLAVVGGSATTENFNATALGALAPATDHDLGLIHFSYSDANSFTSPRIYSPGAIDGSRELEAAIGIDDAQQRPFSNTISFVESPGGVVMAFGADFDGTTNGTGVKVQVGAGGPEANLPAAGFFGVVSTTPFSTLTFLMQVPPLNPNTGEAFGIDNFSFVSSLPAGPVPEPSAIALVSIGVLAFAVRRIRRKIR